MEAEAELEVELEMEMGTVEQSHDVSFLATNVRQTDVCFIVVQCYFSVRLWFWFVICLIHIRTACIFNFLFLFFTLFIYLFSR